MREKIKRQLERLEQAMAPDDECEYVIQVVFVEAKDGRPTGKETPGPVIHLGSPKRKTQETKWGR